MNRKVNVYSFNEECYVYLEDYNKLQQENKQLKENAENNDNVVDKVNWENQLLKKENQELKNQLNKYKNRLNKINIVMYSPNCEEEYITYISFDYLKCKKFIEEYAKYNKYNKYKSYDMFILKNVELEKKLLHFL